MPLAETLIFGPIGSGLIILWFHFFRMEDDKRDNIDKELSNTYRYLRNKVLDPILQDIITNRKAKIDPEKFMSTPEVTEKLRTYKGHLKTFNNASSKQLGILVTLHFTTLTSFFLGLTVIILTAINELYIGTPNNITPLTIFHVAVITTIILIIGLIFLGSFIYHYRKYNDGYRDAIGEVNRWLD